MGMLGEGRAHLDFAGKNIAQKLHFLGSAVISFAVIISQFSRQESSNSLAFDAHLNASQSGMRMSGKTGATQEYLSQSVTELRQHREIWNHVPRLTTECYFLPG